MIMKVQNIRFGNEREMQSYLTESGQERWTFLIEVEPWVFMRMAIINTQDMIAVDEGGLTYQIESMRRVHKFTNSVLPLFEITEAKYLCKGNKTSTN